MLGVGLVSQPRSRPLRLERLTDAIAYFSPWCLSDGAVLRGEVERWHVADTSEGIVG